MAQEERKFEAQRAEQWRPAVGAVVHVPRLGGDAKVSPRTCECCHFSKQKRVPAWRPSAAPALTTRPCIEQLASLTTLGFAVFAGRKSVNRRCRGATCAATRVLSWK